MCCTHTHTHTHTHTMYVHACTHTHTHTRINMCMCTHKHTHTCALACTHTHTQCMRMHAHTHTHTHMQTHTLVEWDLDTAGSFCTSEQTVRGYLAEILNSTGFEHGGRKIAAMPDYNAHIGKGMLTIPSDRIGMRKLGESADDR